MLKIDTQKSGCDQRCQMFPQTLGIRGLQAFSLIQLISPPEGGCLVAQSLGKKLGQPHPQEVSRALGPGQKSLPLPGHKFTTAADHCPVHFFQQSLPTSDGCEGRQCAGNVYRQLQERRHLSGDQSPRNVPRSLADAPQILPNV